MWKEPRTAVKAHVHEYFLPTQRVIAVIKSPRKPMEALRPFGLWNSLNPEISVHRRNSKHTCYTVFDVFCHGLLVVSYITAPLGYLHRRLRMTRTRNLCISTTT